MQATPRIVAGEIKQVLAALRDLGIVSYWNTVLESPNFVSWTTPGPDNATFLLARDDLTVAGYLHWLDTNQYSALLEDGGLLQVSYSFSGHEITGHRLAYIPCPVVLDTDCETMLSEGYSLSDVVQMQMGDPKNLYMKSGIRFDFDPAAAGIGHPASHFTINSTDCRIACASPIRIGRFLDFVFQHFYSGRYRRHTYLRELQLSGWFTSTLPAGDRKAIHMNWG